MYILKNYQKIIFLIFLVFLGMLFSGISLGEIKLEARKILKSVNLLTVCDETLYYSLGDIDPRFNISQEDILTILSEAENVWERELGKNVFEYRQGAKFKVNFIFDERQKRANDQTNLDKELNELEYNKEGLSQEYQAIYANYQAKVSIYEKNAREYEEKIKEYEKRVKKWNKADDRSKEEYEELKKEESSINSQRKEVEKSTSEINKLADQLNALAKKEKKMTINYNEKVNTYKEKYGDSLEFNQGEYDGLGIDIYQFHERNDLKLVLAHELGHSLGVNHVENSESLMYYLMENQDLDNIHLTQEDLGVIKNICKIR